MFSGGVHLSLPVFTWLLRPISIVDDSCGRTKDELTKYTGMITGSYITVEVLNSNMIPGITYQPSENTHDVNHIAP